MPGPAPKPDPVRRHRREVEWSDLPADGNPAPTPDPPVDLAGGGLVWWEWAWGTPASTQWTDDDMFAVVHRAQLEELWQAEKLAVTALSELRLLDQGLGLNPKGRKELRWRTVATDGEITEQAGLTDEVQDQRKKRKVRDAQAS